MARRSARGLLVAGTMVVAASLGTTPASAHNVLVSSSPESGSSVGAAPSQVQLVFDQPVQNQFNQVVVRGPDGQDWAAGPIEVLGGTVTSALRPLQDPGAYTVAYRIVSADGHPVTGEVPFTVAAGAAGLVPPEQASTSTAASASSTSPAPQPTGDRPSSPVAPSTGSAADAGGDGIGGGSWGVTIPLAVVLVLGVALVARRLRVRGAEARDNALGADAGQHDAGPRAGS